MDEMQSKLEAELAKLRDSYLEKLPADLDALAQLALKLPATAERAQLEEIHLRLHKLAGSGGTFGLTKMSERARHLENIARDWLEGTLPDAGQAVLREWAAGVQDLSEMLASVTNVTPAEAAETGVYVRARAASIWVVGDEARLGRDVQRYLQPFGYEVSTFPNFAAAEAAQIHGLRPDALIVDEMTQRAEGRLLQEHVLLRSARCPMLFASSSGDFQSRLNAVRLGAYGYLPEPLNPAQLLEHLGALFGTEHEERPRVLIVDDDTMLSAHFRLVLSAAGMEVEVLNDAKAVIESVRIFSPDMILIDVHMSACTGPELAALIRHHENWVGLPIVYLTTEQDGEGQLRETEWGAEDFLVRPLSDAHLVAAVRMRATRARNLAEILIKDHLTGLLRHTAVTEAMDKELSRARRSGKPLCVVIADIDHLAQLNAAHGHALGDEVIRELAHLLRNRLRKSDVIGRYGGEEFAIVLPECDAKTALGIMNDVRERFSSLHFQHGEHEFSCTLSAGVASFSPHAQVTVDDLLHAVSVALHKAKLSGRNQVRVAQ